MDNWSVLLLHKHPEYLLECCNLLNSEWKRSDTARLRILEQSCDTLPINFILVKDGAVIGHAKLGTVYNLEDVGFAESVVIHTNFRGQGFGRYLMQKLEEYAIEVLKLNCIYLSTRGQEEFYRKLGYKECQPPCFYGKIVEPNYLQNKVSLNVKGLDNGKNAPKPPPLPKLNVPDNIKTFMCKNINI